MIQMKMLYNYKNKYKMRTKFLILMAIFFTAFTFAQVTTHRSAVRIKKTPPATTTDTLVAIDNNGLVRKTNISVGDVGSSSGANIYTSNGVIPPSVNRLMQLGIDADFTIETNDGSSMNIYPDVGGYGFDLVFNEINLSAGSNGFNWSSSRSVELIGTNGVQIRPGVGGLITPSVAGQVLTAVDANGTAVWQDPTGGGSGSLPLNQIGVGNGTSIVGFSGFTYDDTSKTLSLTTDGSANDSAFLNVNGTQELEFRDSDGTIRTNNEIFSNGYTVNGGTSSQFLKADGTVDSNSYLTDAPSDSNDYVRNNGSWVVSSGGTSQSPSLIGPFNGQLDLSNMYYNYYTDYDLSVNGPITFSVVDSTLFGQAYLKIKSDGVTKWIPSTTSLDSIFNEQPSGLPVDNILAEGDYSFYAWKTPNGNAFSLNPVVDYVPETPVVDDLPFFDDAVLYVDLFKDTPTLNGINVESIPNRANGGGVLENLTGTKQPTYDAITEQLVFAGDSVYLQQPSIPITRGTHTLVLVGETISGTNDFSFGFDRSSTGLERFYFDFLNNSGLWNAVRAFNQQSVNVSIQYPLTGAFPTGTFLGKFIIVLSVDVPNTTSNLYRRTEEDLVTAVRQQNTNASSVVDSFEVDALISAETGFEFKFKVGVVYDRVMSSAEAETILDYFQTLYPLN